MNTDYAQILRLAFPETIVAVAGLAVLFIDLVLMRGESLRNRWQTCLIVSLLACGAAIAGMFLGPAFGAVPGGMFVADPLTRLVKAALLVMTLLTLLVSSESAFTGHIGEYVSLILLATVGMMFLVSAEELLMAFVSLELTSLSLYILTAFNKRDIQSAEAAMKYFLFGGMSAAFLLFGLSLVYGLAGSTNLQALGARLAAAPLDPLLAVALVMIVAGFGFKVAAVPFHLWAPDAYQGAPTPSAAFIASGSKLASFFILAKVLMFGLDGAAGSGAWRHFVPGWAPVLATVAALSMVLGNLAAIAQANVKRLLAYSAIAHGGYALLGLLANNASGLASLVYYAVTYGVTAVGAFAVIAVVETRSGGCGMADFAGLSRRSPGLAAAMLVFMLSLAGVPPLAGFFGKFYLFAAAAGAGRASLGLLWLVILAVAMSAVSLYYYLQVLKQMFVTEPADDAPPVKVPVAVSIALLVAVAAVVALGCHPDALVEPLMEAIAPQEAPPPLAGGLETGE